MADTHTHKCPRCNKLYEHTIPHGEMCYFMPGRFRVCEDCNRYTQIENRQLELQFLIDGIAVLAIIAICIITGLLISYHKLDSRVKDLEMMYSHVDYKGYDHIHIGSHGDILTCSTIREQVYCSWRDEQGVKYDTH